MDATSVEKMRQEVDLLKAQIAEKERAIRELSLQNRFLETLLDGVSEDIMIVDADYNIVDVNRRFLDRYGLDRGGIQGRKCYEVKGKAGAPCHREGEDCPLRKAIESGQRIEMTHSHRDREGGGREHALIMYPIALEEGKPAYYLEIARDETDYRALIGKLQASRMRFRSILDTATDGILSIDQNHRITLFNNAAQRIFGYTRDEIIGKDLNILIPPQYGDHRVFVKRFLEDRESDIVGKVISLTALRKGGEEFPIELSLSFLEFGDQVTFTAIIRDVTKRKALRKKLLQSERLAAVGEAAAHVVHELKNPLMIIGGFSHQIRKRIEDEKLSRKLDMVLEEVGRLERLVINLGDFIKEYRLVKRQADVNSVLRDVVKIMSGVYPPDQYGFTERLDDGLEETFCDPDKLKQVFINIISNGIEAMPDGGTIRIESEFHPEGILVRISDEGIGIPVEALQHIFEPFFTTRERGSGLGLAISYKIMAAHGGDISAESSLGQGTTFTLRLPA